VKEGKVPTVIPQGLTGRGKRKRSLPNYADMASGKKTKVGAQEDKSKRLVFNAEDVKSEPAKKCSRCGSEFSTPVALKSHVITAHLNLYKGTKYLEWETLGLAGEVNRGIRSTDPENISEDGKHKESPNEFKEAYNFDEDFYPDDDLENGSSQEEEESQYESKYIAEIATLKAGCEGDISAQGTDLQDLEKEIFKDTPNIKSTEKTMALLQEVNMNKLSSNGMKSVSKSKTKGEIEPPQKSVTEPLGRSHQPTGCSIVCDICSKVFQYKSQLAHHATVHSEERPFSCSICSHSFKSKRELKYHMKSCHEPKKLICQFCSKGFHSSSWLKRHEQCVHTGDKPYPCDKCNKKFGAITDLRDHKKRNHEEKVLKCQQCEKSFSCNKLLKSHIKHKHGDKLFNCEYCGYSCVSKQSWNEHLNTHTGNRPHKCKTCEKGFTTHSALRIHNLIHTGVKPYSCSICKQAFRHKQAVEAHEKKHTKVGDQREVA